MVTWLAYRSVQLSGPVRVLVSALGLVMEWAQELGRALGLCLEKVWGVRLEPGWAQASGPG